MKLKWEKTRKNAFIKKMKSEKQIGATGAICGDGLCPYVPCKNFPKCNHFRNTPRIGILKEMKSEKTFKSIQEMIDKNEKKYKEYINTKKPIFSADIEGFTSRRRTLQDVQKHIEKKIKKLEKKQKELDKEEKEIIDDLNAGIGDFSESIELDDIATEKTEIFSKIQVLKELRGQIIC